jgi:Mce-associated membrane protein
VPDRTTPTNETSALASPWLTVLLGVTATVLAVLVALQVHDVGEPTRSRAATGSALADAGTRDRLLDVAATAGTRVLTYHHDTFDADVAANRRFLTPAFADEYAPAMEQVRADAVRDEIDQETTAVSSAVVSATDSRAEVLVFANQQTTAGASGARRVRRTRLVVRLVRDEGRWTVAGVTALG